MLLVWNLRLYAGCASRVLGESDARANWKEERLADMLWPLVVYVAMALALVTSMMVLSWLLGQRHADRATGEPYESGINPTGTARLRLSADFYLIAMFFVIFDLKPCLYSPGPWQLGRSAGSVA